ncbi:hypothetical protein EV424DRAFT_78649 [Suillus variegatus]|nr:hypothetical protein EV424DRAFT_78649 [Suillus variegatus]
MCQAIVPSVVRCHKVIRLVPAIEVHLPVQIFISSTILELNCWLLDDSPKHIFPVNIESARTVGHLKDAIKDRARNRFGDIDAFVLHLWKVNININDVDLLDTIRDQDSVKGGELLNPMVRLRKVFKRSRMAWKMNTFILLWCIIESVTNVSM